jgi:DNA-binding response OmpR family regulator
MPATATDTTIVTEPRISRILVVEDEPLVAIMLDDALEEFGFHVVGPVENLKSAVQLAGCERLDAAVLDVNIDGAISDAVADQLIARGIPFIFVSGYDRTLGLRYSAVPMLRKPFSIEDLHLAVTDLLPKSAA